MKTLKVCQNCKVEYLATKLQKFCSPYCKTKKYREVKKTGDKNESMSLPKITNLSLGFSEALGLMKSLGREQSLLITKRNGRWIVSIRSKH